MATSVMVGFASLPSPVVFFEHVMLYNGTGQLAADAGPVPIGGAAVRREGTDLTLITYGGSLYKTLEAAEVLAGEGIAAEVIDLRSLKPIDRETIRRSVEKTHRMLVAEEDEAVPVTVIPRQRGENGRTTSTSSSIVSGASCSPR